MFDWRLIEASKRRRAADASDLGVEPASFHVSTASFSAALLSFTHSKILSGAAGPHGATSSGLEDPAGWETAERRETSCWLAGLTSHQDPPAVVRVPGAASALPALVHDPRGGEGVVLLLEEAFGQTAERVLVLFAPAEVLALLAVPDLHAGSAGSLLLRAPLLDCE